MTLAPDALPDSAPLPVDLLARVAEARSVADDAELTILLLAVEWAAVNPVLTGQEAWKLEKAPTWLTGGAGESGLGDDDLEWIEVPGVRWDAPAAFAAANGMSTASGKALIRDGLVLAHRTPRFFRAVRAKKVQTWRAREVAQAVMGQPADVCRYVDLEVSRRVADGQPISRRVLERVLDEALLRLHAEERELQQLEELDRRHVTVDPGSINHHGIADLTARGDWADVSAFDETVTRLAEAIKDLPQHQHHSLDERRSIALGILADPVRAQAILDGTVDATPTVRRELTGLLHLTEPHLSGNDPVLTDADLKAHLTQVITTWAARHDIALTIGGIRHCGGEAGGCTRCPATIDCDDHSDHALNDYVPTRLDRAITAAANPTCVHPHCTRPTRRCDCDHVTAFDTGGVTCPKCNLAPLCRHHHRLKTHAGWRYWKLSLGTYLWTDPHGLLYHRTPDGTRQLS